MDDWTSLGQVSTPISPLGGSRRHAAQQTRRCAHGPTTDAYGLPGLLDGYGPPAGRGSVCSPTVPYRGRFFCCLFRLLVPTPLLDALLWGFRCFLLRRLITHCRYPPSRAAQRLIRLLRQRKSRPRTHPPPRAVRKLIRRPRFLWHPSRGILSPRAYPCAERYRGWRRASKEGWIGWACPCQMAMGHFRQPCRLACNSRSFYHVRPLGGASGRGCVLPRLTCMANVRVAPEHRLWSQPGQAQHPLERSYGRPTHAIRLRTAWGWRPKALHSSFRW